MSGFMIRPYAYTDADAAKLAVMWNESDDQWPGTFTEGVPFTTERVREWMDRETGLAILVVDDPQEERIVGFGSLWDRPEQEKTCYVALLNVHPAYQGKSLARRMLTRMIDQAVELGYHRMTIGTWSGNLKSVPLYKKVGFFWVPDTSVDMENFVPLIRQLAIAERYFQRHDWYTTFRRELLQIEDDERHGAMKVYRYHWEEDGESLTVLIDREAKAVTGIETEHLAAYAELDETKPARGLPYPFRWRLTNKREQPVNVSVVAGGNPGIHISQQSAFLLGGGEERVIEGRFTVSPDIRPVKKYMPAPSVRTVLVISGRGASNVVELGTGVRPRPAISVSVEPPLPVLLPGQSRTVHVQLRNHLDRPFRGVVSLAPETGLSADWERLRHEFRLDAKGYAGMPLTVTCDEAGSVPLRFSACFEVKDTQVNTRPQRVPLLCLPPGGVVADIDEGGEKGAEIVVENEFFRLRCGSEGGRCAVWDKINERRITSMLEELGPPFEPSELWRKDYELSLKRDGARGWVKALLCARSDNFPGLAFTKEITLSASPLMTLRYRLTNAGAQTHTVQLNPLVRLNDRERARVTLPRAERLVRERAALFSSTHGDMPKKPEGMAERWLAWRVDDFTVGLFWDDQVQEHEWNWSTVRFNRPPLTLEPGATAETAPMYFYAGPGTWTDVRRIWARLARRSPKTVRRRPRPGRKLEFGFDPSPVLSLSDQVTATLRADSVRELPLDGRFVVEPPVGWRAEPSEFDLQELKRGQPLVATVRLYADGGGNCGVPGRAGGAFTGQLHIAGNRFDASEPFTLIRLGDETTPVRVDETSFQGEQALFVIDNGHSRWHVAPAYCASVVAWYVGTSDVNHLYSAFPQAGGAAMGWLKPWFGGVRPILPLPGEDDEGWPGKLHEERFAAQICEQTDERGFLWRGVSLSARLRREEFQGLRAEVAYLTVGRSNLLKVVYRLMNETDIYRRVEPGVLAFCQVDGRHDNGALHGDGVQRKRTPVMAWPQVGRWGAVTNPESERTLVLVKGTARASLELSDWGQDGGHLLCYQSLVIPPRGQDEVVVYLALTDALGEARRYAALEGAD